MHRFGGRGGMAVAVIKREVNGSRYLFWVTRIGGIRHSSYLGSANPSDPFVRCQVRDFVRKARRFDRETARMREEARGHRERARAARAEREAFDREVLGAARALGVAADALMVLAGYTRHERQLHYRKSRRKAMREDITIDTPGGLSAEQVAAFDAAVESLLEKSPGGDPRLSAALADPQVCRRLVHRVGRPAFRVVNLMLDDVAFGCPGVAEIGRRGYADLRTALEGPSPTTVERLLAERCAITWLHLGRVELKREQARLEDADDARVARADRRVNVANRAHLAALKALAAVRRVDLRGLQVNLAAGDQQVVNAST